MVPYHYTSAADLHGIITSKSLWASDYRFLNDTSEFRYGLDILFNAIDRRKAEISRLSADAWNEIVLLREHNDLEGVYAFVASLTSVPVHLIGPSMNGAFGRVTIKCTVIPQIRARAIWAISSIARVVRQEAADEAQPMTAPWVAGVYAAGWGPPAAGTGTKPGLLTSSV
jgi:hypothetical protein